MKNNQRGFIGIGVMILIALVVIGGGTYFYTQNNKSSHIVDNTNLYVENTDSASEISDIKGNNNSVGTSSEENKPSSKEAVTTSHVSVITETSSPVNNSEKPDLTIEDIKIYEPASPKETGGYQRLTVRICNRGKVGINTGNLTKEPEKISVSFTLNGKTDYSRRSAPSISEGQCELEGFQFIDINPSYGVFKGIKTGSYTVSAKIDAETSKVDESNENNNVFTKDIYLDFEPTVKELSIISPTAGTVWKEGNEYAISWQPLEGEGASYYVGIGNYSSQTNVYGTPYLQIRNISKTSSIVTVQKGFVQGMFFGDAKGKTAQDIKNSFYISIDAKDASGQELGTAKTETFTIEP